MIYSEAKRGRTFIIRLEHGEIIHEKIEKLPNTDSNFLSWKTKELFFENDSLAYVITKINETYHTNIQFQDTTLKNCSLSAQFKNQKLNDVLNVISKTLDLTIEKEGERLLINGSGCEE